MGKYNFWKLICLPLMAGCFRDILLGVNIFKSRGILFCYLIIIN
jgi:hypothetical protein